MSIRYLIYWNIFVFLIYGIDKFNAKHHMWRVPNSVMLSLAFLMGGVGAFLGMRIFNHKTRRGEFGLLVPPSILANIAVYYFFKLL